MARLEGLFQFTGNLDQLTAYRRSDSDKIIVRMKGGATKERIKSAPEFINTRRNNSEFGGRSRASQWVRRLFFQLWGTSDYGMSGAMTGRMIRVQKLDTEGHWGERHVLISKHPQLLEGFPLNKRTGWESVVQAPLSYKLSKEDLSLHLELPGLIPGITFQGRKDFPLYQITVILGLVPDLFYDPNGYKPHEGYNHHQNKVWESPWHTTTKGSEAQSIDLKLDENLPDQNHSLMLVVGLRYGKMLPDNKVEMVKRVGAGKIVALV